MAGKVFQVQAKDSVARLNAFDALNAVQNLNLDPTFNEEYYSELGNSFYAAQSRQPETSGSFEVTGTASIPAMLARMIFNYSTQAYLFSPSTKGNAYTITETDLENAVFDLLNLKKPGETFADCTLVPNAQLTGLSLRVDATGASSETYNFEADLQEAFYDPYHDMVTVPLSTTGATTADIPAAYSSTINSGTHYIMYVFKDNQKFDSTVATWTANDEITISGADLTTTDPYDRVSAVLYARTPGSFPTIYYPTSARFVRGDRIDIWLVNSGTSISDANRLLRCQSADVNIDLTRDRLSQILRNDDKSTTFWRALNYPLNITATVNILENTLQQWASLQGKTLNESATGDTIDTNNLMNLVDFETQKLVIRYYLEGDDNYVAEVLISDMNVTSFGESQQVQGRAERTIGLTGSQLTITGQDI